MRVLSIIVSYNFEPWLDKCLSSLLNSTYPTDVIVIDNASRDNTAVQIRQKYPEVLLIENNENLGFGRANNLGIQYALKNNYDFVFLVNQDAWVHPDCLNNLLNTSYPEHVGVISPLHYDGTTQALDKGFNHYIQSLDLRLENTTAPFINAAFWLIPSTTLTRIGAFSPLFYHYGEDKDFANRLRYHGLTIAVNQQAIAYHDRQSRPEKLPETAIYKSEFVYFLTEYANINYTFIKAFGYSVIAALKKAVTKSTALSFTAYIRISVALIGRTGAVVRTRKENKESGNGHRKYI